MQQVPISFKLLASTILGRVVSEKLYRDEIEVHEMKKKVSMTAFVKMKNSGRKFSFFCGRNDYTFGRTFCPSLYCKAIAIHTERNVRVTEIFCDLNKFRPQVYVPESAAEKAEENYCPPLFFLGL